MEGGERLDLDSEKRMNARTGNDKSSSRRAESQSLLRGTVAFIQDTCEGHPSGGGARGDCDDTLRDAQLMRRDA